MSLVESDFPLIHNLKNANTSYVYLDNAATSLKPWAVINAVTEYYTHCGANIHRGSYKESERATLAYEHTRDLIAQFINCKKQEVIFTRGTTDSINLLADLLEIKASDTIVNCIHEHHANFIPWKERGNLITVGLTSDGVIDLTALESTLANNNVKLVTISHASNVTGNIQPIHQVISLARQYNTLICIDGAQVVSHRPLDLMELCADFYVFSGHKMLGPSGTGVLFIREEILSTLPYKRFGGGMVNIYNLQQSVFKRAPHGFEPGTPAIEGVIGLGKAIEYLQAVGFQVIDNHLNAWSCRFLKQLENSGWALAFAKSQDSLPIFTLHPKRADVDLSYFARILSDTYNIAVNDGQQCCGPLYAANGLNAGLRVSAHFYNSLTEVDYFFECLDQLFFFIGKGSY